MHKPHIVLLAALLASACCPRERTATLIGPGLGLESLRSDAAAPPHELDAGATVETGPPVVATFIDLSREGAQVAVRACEQVVVAVAKGHAEALSESLGEGDLLLVRGAVTTFPLRGEGLAMLAVVRPPSCAGEPSLTTFRKVVRASAAPALSWAAGAMHAHLDAEDDVSPLVYVGRLRGTASVAEHAHRGSWEVIGAFQASGTFTLGGKTGRLGPRNVVVVPPDMKHSWTPDPGTELVAFQLYAPPGPEQRLRALAAADGPPVDAGVTSATDAGRDAGAAPGKRAAGKITKKR